MNTDSAKKIKSYLEKFYDIPFVVNRMLLSNEACFEIKPKNDYKELFNINVKYKNNIRIVIEVSPEEYAANSIRDMATASTVQKKMFAEYGKQLQERKARVDFYINNLPNDVTKPESWPSVWTSYGLRVSKSPICDENEVLDEATVTIDWTTIITGMFLSLLDVTKIEESAQHFEGGLKRVETNRYERNPVNRGLCLAANGYICQICGFDFEKEYGEIGQQFIHVHHIIPISKMEKEYIIDPIHDLIPVCPNCHAMLHRKDPPLLPAELKERITSIKNEGTH